MEKRVNFLLASILASYPDEKFSEYVGALLDETRLTISKRFHEQLSLLIKDKSKLDDLRSQYIDLFDRGPSSNSLYETEYGRARAMVKGSELADLAGFYKAFGFEMNEESREMLDHVSVELEFYTLLLMKQIALEETDDQEGIETVLDARKKFLKDHLGRFTGAISEQSSVQTSPFYSEVFKFCSELTKKECDELGLSVVPASWISAEAEKCEMSCGALTGRMESEVKKCLD